VNLPKHRLNQIEKQLAGGRLVERRVSVRQALAQRRDCSSSAFEGERRCAVTVSGSMCHTMTPASCTILNQLEPLGAHRVLQRLEAGGLGVDQTLQTRCIVAIRDAPADTDLQRSNPALRSLSWVAFPTRRRADQPALGVGNLRANQR
jgi:hypothetical protein